MATNLEIKARIRDFDKVRGLVEQLSDRPCEMIQQEDTFFYTSNGRLKLRTLAPDRGELIYYKRENSSGPRQSHYLKSTTTNPNSLKAVLSAALGVRGVVRKQRLLYKVGNTRIHLDEVNGLGSFLELEVVLSPGQTTEQGEATASELMMKLGIQKADLVDVAYIDLLESRAV
jgi:predicted adenylyl cyclase CyaB